MALSIWGMRSFELGDLDRNSMLKLTLCRIFFKPFEARVLGLYKVGKIFARYFFLH